jgi:transposase InsO family protein
LIEQGIPISRKRVARLMQAEGLKARVRKRFRSTTMSDHDQPIAGKRIRLPLCALTVNPA